MKALLTVASLRPSYGGPANSVSQLAVALIDAGAEVGVWAPDGSADDTNLINRNSAVRRFTGDARTVVGDFAPQILHDNGIWLPHNYVLRRLAAAHRIPRVVSLRGMLDPWALRHKAWKKRIAWAAYQAADLRAAQRLHATAQMEADNIAAWNLGVPVVVVRNGIQCPIAGATRPSPSDPLTALFLGRIYPVKGLPMLVEAWARVRPQGWRLQIAGPDEAGHQSEVAAAIRATGLEGAIQFLGPLTGAAKAKAFANAHLFVLPSHSESFGMAIGEALAHGVPVLTTKGAPWPGLELAGAGWWVEASVGGLAEGLQAATRTSRRALHAMGQRGSAMIENGFSWPSAAAAMLSLYTDAVSDFVGP